jgi:GNAT superfamily N-acetyltransferase
MRIVVDGGFGMEIVQLQTPSDAFGQAMNKLMIAYNREKVGAVGNTATLNLGLRDSNGVEMEGGLRGEIYWNWLIIYQLVIPQDVRGKGIGSRLLQNAEECGRQNGCVGVWLDTFSFQAPDFYRKRGYEVFAELNCYPNGFSRIFLRKPISANRGCSCADERRGPSYFFLVAFRPMSLSVCGGRAVKPIPRSVDEDKRGGVGRSLQIVRCSPR